VVSSLVTTSTGQGRGLSHRLYLEAESSSRGSRSGAPPAAQLLAFRAPRLAALLTVDRQHIP
jgi:hypothetical protein